MLISAVGRAGPLPRRKYLVATEGGIMTDAIQPMPAVSLPRGFEIQQVLATPHLMGPLPSPPTLGPLAAFVGDWHGTGFNTIFRPDSHETPTPLPIPAGRDTVLELNRTSEFLSFSASLGSDPNREMVQGDLLLNGVPHLQTVNKVTNVSRITEFR